MEKILIIDDDESIRQTLSNYLKRLGYSVLSAEDGKIGFDIIQNLQPDLIISDIKMPNLTGLELLKKVKEIDPLTKIILITAHDDVQTTIEAMQNGAYDYLEKPLDIERLKVTIARALESKTLSERIDTLIEDQAEEFQPEKRIIGKSKLMRDVYKIIGQLMIKSNKAQMVEELENKIKILDLREKALEKQENSFFELFKSIFTSMTGIDQHG